MVNIFCPNNKPRCKNMNKIDGSCSRDIVILDFDLSSMDNRAFKKMNLLSCRFYEPELENEKNE